LHKRSSCEMESLVDIVVGNVEWPSGALASRCRTGANGAQLSRMAVHKEIGFYINSRKTICNNKAK
jgi:hypothetical protein